MRSPSILVAVLLAMICVGCGSDDASGTAIAESTTTAPTLAPVEAPPEAAEQCTELGGELAPELRDDGLVHCLGEALVVLAEGADGIDAFNAAAIECFDGSPICPSRQLAVVISGRVVTAPMINAPSFERDRIMLAGGFDEDEANRIADDLIGAGSFRPILFSLPADG